VLSIDIMSIAWLAAAAAPGDAPTPPQPRSPIIIEGNRRVCTWIVATGSILPQRICKTAEQLQLEHADSQRLLDQRAREQVTLQQSMIHEKARDPP